MSTTQAQRDERTPASPGVTTDNPIYRAERVTSGLIKGTSGYEVTEIPEGTELRLLACQPAEHVSPYAYYGSVITLPNADMALVEGNVGPELDGTYTKVADYAPSEA